MHFLCSVRREESPLADLEEERARWCRLRTRELDSFVGFSLRDIYRRKKFDYGSLILASVKANAGRVFPRKFSTWISPGGWEGADLFFEPYKVLALKLRFPPIDRKTVPSVTATVTECRLWGLREILCIRG